MRNFRVFLAAVLLFQFFCLAQVNGGTSRAQDMMDHCPVEHCLAHAGQATPILNNFNSSDPVDRPAPTQVYVQLSYIEPVSLVQTPQELSTFLSQTKNIVLRI